MMRAILLSLILVVSPWAGAWPHLQDALLGVVLLLAGVTLLTDARARANSVLPFLFLFIFAVFISCAMSSHWGYEKIAQIALFCVLPVLLAGMKECSHKWLATVMLLVTVGLMAASSAALIGGFAVKELALRNPYVPAVTICAGIPFLLLSSALLWRVFAVLLLVVLPLLLPLSICLALFAGLGVTAVLYSTRRRVIGAACLLFLISFLIVYTYNGHPIRNTPQNDLTLYEERDISPRYAEMASAFTVFSEHPMIGVGGGNYQANIGTGYGMLPKTNHLPDGGQCGWLVIAVEYGLAGLGALGGLVLLALRAWHQKLRTPAPQTITVAAGVGTLVLCLSGLFTPLLTREAGPVWFILLGILLCRQTVNHEK